MYGFVRRSELVNTSEETINVEILDGIQNIIPYGVGSDLQRASSNLVDAYKRSELDKRTGLGIFALSSIIVDKSYHSASIEMSALGIPRIRSGNFALVYKLKLSNHDKALRVFYRTNFDIANRYEEIIKVIN